MNKLYREKLIINDQWSMQIDPENDKNLLIFENDEVKDVFSLKRKTYTLFRILQEFTEEDKRLNYLKNIHLYGKSIPITKDLMMRLMDTNGRFIVEIYKPMKKGDHEIIYALKGTVTTETLFKSIPIAIDAYKNPNIRNNFPQLFQDMMEILGLIQI